MLQLVDMVVLNLDLVLWYGTLPCGYGVENGVDVMCQTTCFLFGLCCTSMSFVEPWVLNILT